MIKFFRHIRQSLIKDNKMGKYFKYAIGEILLVMVGILLALQVNNWNERKKNEATLTQFLMDFKEELSLNIRDFKHEVKRIDKQIAQKNTILLNTRLDTISIDTLENHITTRYIQVSYNSSVLKRFENAQIENHGKYDSIFGDLQEIFGFTWSTLDISKNWHNNQVDREDEYWRYEQNSYELKLSSGDNTFIEDSSLRKNELIKLIQTPLVRNMLKSDIYRKKGIKPQIEYYIETAERAYKEINKIIE